MTTSITIYRSIASKDAVSAAGWASAVIIRFARKTTLRWLGRRYIKSQISRMREADEHRDQLREQAVLTRISSQVNPLY
jgi:hypothetical protein